MKLKYPVQILKVEMIENRLVTCYKDLKSALCGSFILKFSDNLLSSCIYEYESDEFRSNIRIFSPIKIGHDGLKKKI